MRGTNAIVYKIFTCFIIGVLLLGYLPAPVNANPSTIVVDNTALHKPASWPTSFTAYTDVNGNIITDENGEIEPTRADITSGPTISGTSPEHGPDPSVYMNSDGANMFFRMRIGGNPVKNNGEFFNTNYMITIGTLSVNHNHWESALAIGFNGNTEGNFNGNGNGNNGSYVYLTKDGDSITKVYNVTATDLVNDETQGAEVVPISDGTGQYFLDFQVPISELKKFTDINGNYFQDTTPMRLFYATSQSANLAVINKDMMDSAGGTITPVDPAVLPALTLKVLEVQPGTTYDLTSLLSETFPNSTIDITQMSMAEFISKVDEINGQYDIVYIGDNTTGAAYTALGRATTEYTTTEYYSENDITDRRANTLKDYVYSHQFIMFAQSIVSSNSSLKDTKLYKNFNTFGNDATYPNFKIVNTTNNKNKNLTDMLKTYNTSSVTKRPVLKFNSRPMQYDGTDGSYQAVKSLGFSFDIDNLTNVNNMTVKLYIDINGDGIFKAIDNYAGKPEVVYQMDHINSGAGYTVNYHLPESFIGLQPWKLELTDTSTASTETTGTKSYVTGATAFKGTNSGDEVNIRLLQITPTVKTYNTSIYDLRNVDGQNLLYKDKVYRINVTEMDADVFNAAYANLPANKIPLPATAKVNGVTTTASTVLNGNYDMVIIGFADGGAASDLTNANSIQALKSFISTNQSVMFTHDNLQNKNDRGSTWGINITENFRSIVGQQRYYRTPPDSDPNRTYDPMPDPDPSKNSYGFSRLTLDWFENGNVKANFPRTTQTHKINDNLVTQFPFPLGDITVAPTHLQYYQLDLEDENVVPVYTLTGDSVYNYPGDGRNEYYTYTKGNITFSGTGDRKASDDNYIEEEKMFINTVIKASRGANHAPTLDIYGLSDGMDIANSLTSIDFSFKATDIDLNDQYLNADIYLSSDNGATYQTIKSFRALDPDESKRIKSGVSQTVNVPTPTNRTSINAYKVKVVVTDNFNAQTTKEILLNCVQDPQIAVQSFEASCLVGDSISVPVNLTAVATSLNETFDSIKLQGIMTKPDKTSATAYSNDYPELIFNPNSSWTNNNQTSSFPLTFDTVGDYTILNKLTYSAYNGVPPDLSGMTSRTNEQSFKVSVGSGTLEVEVLDMKGRGIPGITMNVTGSHTGTTVESGLASFTELSSGDYTVTLVVPNGYSIVGSASQTVSLSADNPYQPIKFKLSGDLISNPKITTRTGANAISILKKVPIQGTVKVTLSRAVKYLKMDFLGSTVNIELSNMYCDNSNGHLPIDFDNTTDPEKFLPKDLNGTFPSGTYTFDALITGADSDLTIKLKASAQDTKDYTEDITTATSADFLTITVGTAPPLH